MYMKFIIFGLIVSSCIGYFYYSQHKIESLVANNSQLIQQNEQYKLAVSELTVAMEKQKQLASQFNEEARAAKQLANEALEVLDKHNLEFLSYAKPDLIQKRINGATNKVFKDIQNEINN